MNAPGLVVEMLLKGLTSYSCESFRLSLALSSSVCSASSLMGMGGWFIIPASAAEDKNTQSNADHGKKQGLQVSACDQCKCV